MKEHVIKIVSNTKLKFTNSPIYLTLKILLKIILFATKNCKAVLETHESFARKSIQLYITSRRGLNGILVLMQANGVSERKGRTGNSDMFGYRVLPYKRSYLQERRQQSVNTIKEQLL